MTVDVGLVELDRGESRLLDQVAIDVELGHHGRGRTTVGVKAKLEAGVVAAHRGGLKVARCPP